MEMISASTDIDVSDEETSRKLGLAEPFDLIPVAGVMIYPFLLRGFHLTVSEPPLNPLAPVFLALAFCVPLLSLLFAMREHTPASLRRLAFIGVTAPTAYVFLGVVQALVSSPIPDEVIWLAFWGVGTALAWIGATPPAPIDAAAKTSRWRVAHGVAGAVVLLYVLFHVTNHLFGLLGPAWHATVMNVGRHVYRQRVIEPILVLLLVFQVGTGARLAWAWSANRSDFYRTFQVASGFYLAVFMIGHMNSVFVYARRFLKIQTDWNFGIGAPTGLIHDAWNIRLLPHYWLGVFFVLAHLASGVRVVMLAHGMDEQKANWIWQRGAVLAGLIATAILAGMCGVRLD
jgi:hypothetical protein